MNVLYPYQLFDRPLENLPDTICLEDHLSGFDQHFFNPILSKLDAYCKNNNTVVYYHQLIESDVIKKYPNLRLKFNLPAHIKRNLWQAFNDYTQHPEIHYKNFICSFNGGDHISRKLMVAILKQFDYFNSEYSSKNFVFTVDKIDGHLTDYVYDQNRFYRKFFIAADSDTFFNTVNSFGHVRFNHAQNIYNLELKLTESFLHIVSESMATSYVPFVTEKFLYSIVTRGLFLTYAQPGWHDHVEKYYGFKRYTKLFDYRFDNIINPVERLVELMTMVGKFKFLSSDDWTELYQIEQETIEYNYDHYFSGGYLECLKKYE